ncbi:hypothetical protein [Variovorax saccharolyticus]|uniref:hypothetical protein n=1 Tax=Variovorax saccharolyticus TaxID=3053516 RepID=UPI002576E1A7|nr:hypothetical protein [Variovorax sp. J22R187]MDM0018178.1 hypothetical protein [Variovorax sp. J22R187]
MAEPWEDFQPAAKGEPWNDFKAPPRVEVRGTSVDEPSLRERLETALKPEPGGFMDVLGTGVADLGVGIARGAKNIVTGSDKVITDIAGLKHARPQPTEALDAAYDRTGMMGGVGNVVPELALTAVPIARAAKVASAFPRALGLSRAAPLVGDVAANAGYEAAKAGLSGGDPGDAAWKGAGGAAGGRMAGNLIGRMTGGITAEAQQLLKRGITPSPGQAFGGEGIVAGAERTLSSFPLAGAAVDRAKKRALKQYSEAEIDQALKETGIPHDGSGFKAVRQINAQIDQAYERVKPQTFLTPQDVKRAAGQTQQAVRSIPLLTDAQEGVVARYYAQKIAPLVQKGNAIDGVTAKKIDREIGEFARSHAHSDNPADHPLGMAFYALQSNMRDALKSNDPQVLQMLTQLNGAYKRMLPVNIATERATGTRGQFTPDQFRAASTRSKVSARDPRLALNDAARETLNEPGTGLSRSLSRNLGVPGLGAAAAAGAHMAGVPAPVVAGGAAALGLGGTALSHALYSETGIRMMIGAMSLPAQTRQWVEKLSPEMQAEFVQRMVHQVPELKQLAAQVGSHIAAQQGVQP